jgi:SAM-dependent methyltransferase
MYRLMKAFSLAAILGFALSLNTATAQEQKKESDFKPIEGMDGKDVTWVGTDMVAVNQMLDMARVTDKDFVIDLGSGDGRMVITAAKRGAKGLGIEYNPKLVELSKRLAQKEGVTDKAEFVHGDIFKSDFSKATVLMMYLLPELNRKLRPIILNMTPGTRVTSIAFDMGAWKAEESRYVKACQMGDTCMAYLWIVPAKVAGRWKLGDGELAIKQRFQHFSGTYRQGGKRYRISNGRLDGADITFRFDDRIYIGRVDGDKMTGNVRSSAKSDGATTQWSAEKVAARTKQK